MHTIFWLKGKLMNRLNARSALGGLVGMRGNQACHIVALAGGLVIMHELVRRK
jgi:hypothetical protein